MRPPSSSPPSPEGKARVSLPLRATSESVGRDAARPRKGRTAKAAPDKARTPAIACGCCTNPRRARWIRSKAGLRKRPSRSSRATCGSRRGPAQPLWHALPRAGSALSETALCNSLACLRSRHPPTDVINPECCASPCERGAADVRPPDWARAVRLWPKSKGTPSKPLQSTALAAALDHRFFPANRRKLQREADRLTRERSLVRNQPRPCRRSASRDRRPGVSATARRPAWLDDGAYRSNCSRTSVE